jgi:hypothetical protein
MSYPRTLANMDKNVKRRKSRLRITSPPAPTRLTQYVQLALSALICQDVCLSSVLISTPHTLRLFHILQWRYTLRDASDGHAPTRVQGKKVICFLRRNAPYACSGGSCCFYASCPWLGEVVMRRATMSRLASGQKRVRPFSKHAAMVLIWHTGTGSQAISPP